MDRRKMLFTASVALASPALVMRATAETSSDYLTKTLTIGTLSKKMSQLAAEKATNARIKEFAGFEIAEQTAVAQVLTDKLEPPPAPLPPKEQEILDKLSLEKGTSFEKAYLRGQIEGHEKLLVVQDAELKGGFASDRGHIAKLAQGVIKMHLAMLHDLEKTLAG